MHAPQTTSDPWEIEFPENPGYHIKAVDGVFNLYRDAEHTDNLNYSYLKLDDFVQDMHRICAMMADGPLWVEFYFRGLNNSHSEFEKYIFNFFSFHGTENLFAIVVLAILIRNFNCMFCWTSWENWLHRKLCHIEISIIFGKNWTLWIFSQTFSEFRRKVISIFFVIQQSGYAHSRCVVYEPKASVAFY